MVKKLKSFAVILCTLVFALCSLPFGLTVKAATVTPHFVFQIDGTAVSVTSANVATTSYSTVYDGTQKKPSVSDVRFVGADGKSSSVLAEETDYTVAYGDNNTNADKGTTKGGTITITGAGTYADVSTAVSFSIRKATPSVSIVGDTSITKTYDGAAVEIDSTQYTTSSSALTTAVTYTGLKAGQAAPVDQGRYTATITATVPNADKDNFAGTKATATIPITINPASLENATVNVTGGSTQAYTGSQIKPAVDSVTIALNGKKKTLTSDVDYNKNIRYGANKEAGSTGYVYVDAKSGSNYTGTATGKFTISSAATNSIAGATIKINGVKDGETAEYAYTGNPITPGVTVWMGKTQLSTADYDVHYSDNVSVGTATITVTGKRNYSSSTSATKTFDIKANEITSASIQAISDQEYTGSPITPQVVVKVGNTVVSDDYYTVSYRNNTDVGNKTAVVTVTAKAGPNRDTRYTGRGEKTFTIKPHQIKSDDVEISSQATYTGSNVRPASIKVYKNSKSSDLLAENTAYTVSCTNNVNVGTATCTIKGIAPNYTGTVSKTYQIVNGQGTIDISDAAIGNISDQTYTGSEIKPGISVTFNGTGFSSSNYDVRYFNNVNAGQATVYIYGKGKYTGSARKNFQIKAADINRVSVSGLPAQKYTGYAVSPIPVVSFAGKTLSLGKDYTLGYQNNTEKGTGYVLINGAGNFTGQKKVAFSITDTPEEKKVWATGFTLNDTYTVVNGGTVTIDPILNPSDANKYTIRWSFSNANFKFVDGDQTNTAETTDSVGAVVKGASEGSTIITATLYDENSKEIGTQYTLVKTGKQFSDVPQDYYTNAVNTLANYGYTTGSGSTREWHATPVINGTSSTTFTPSGDVTRAQFVMMLYNKAVADYKAGKSSSDPSKAPASSFSDVTSYKEAINWAVANGITFGKGNNTFDPNGTVTRAEAVAFLQRYMKGGNANTTKFTDVKNDAYYAGAVGWAVANGITAGTSNTTFSPQQKCNRAQAATFIYRAAF